MPYTLTTPRPGHGGLNWDGVIENDLAGIAGAINGSGWVTSNTGITTPGNWTLTNVRYRVLNGVVALGITATRITTATGAANTSGVAAATPVAQMPAALTPAWANGVIASVGSNGTIQAAGYISSTGLFNITTLTPGQSVPVGGVLDLMGTYFL